MEFVNRRIASMFLKRPKSETHLLATIIAANKEVMNATVKTDRKKKYLLPKCITI